MERDRKYPCLSFRRQNIQKDPGSSNCVGSKNKNDHTPIMGQSGGKIKMAKTIKVTSAGVIFLEDVDFSSYKGLQKTVGGFFETVKTPRLWDYFGKPVVMIVDEEDLRAPDEGDLEEWKTRMLADFRFLKEGGCA